LDRNTTTVTKVTITRLVATVFFAHDKLYGLYLVMLRVRIHY